MLSYQCPLHLNTNTSTKSSLGKYSESILVYGGLEKKYKCFCYKTSDSLRLYLLSTFNKKLAQVKF